jgi:hypothetical protein
MQGWTVIVSAAVTLDLEDAVAADLREAHTALQALAPADIHVHVYLSGPAFPVLKTWSWPPGPGGSTEAPPLDDVFADTTCWADPQRKRMLVLWGHGTRAFEGATGARSAALARLDDLGPDVVSPAGIVDTLHVGTPQAFLAPHIIGYDACRMATWSTIRELSQNFREALFVGSMVPEPASGWPYFELVDILARDLEPRAVAAAAVEAYAASVDTDDWCLVALDLAKIAGGGPGLDEEVADLPDVHAARPGLAAALQALLLSAAPHPVDFYAAAEGADILDDTNLADLGALMRRIDTNHPNSEARAVRRALRGAIVTRRAGGGLAGRDGLAVRIGLPPPWVEGGDPPWPAPPALPGWPNYLPGL